MHKYNMLLFEIYTKLHIVYPKRVCNNGIQLNALIGGIITKQSVRFVQH